MLDGATEKDDRRQRRQRVLSRVLLGLSAGACVVLLLPFWPSLILALWTSSLSRPLVERLTRWIHGRRRAAALVTVGLLIVALAPIAAGLAAVVPDVVELGQRALSSKSGPGAVLELVSGPSQPQANPTGPAPHAGPDTSAKGAPSKLVRIVQSHGKEAWSAAALLAGATGHVALGVLIYFVATFGLLVQGREAYLWLRERIPLEARATDRLRAAFQETGKGLLYSVALTAVLIALVATAAYLALGIPRAPALGLATLIASLLPAVGPFLVWGPVALGLLLAGHAIKAAILAGVCIAVVAPIDHFVRPYLARRGKLQLDPLIVFLSMFGGVVCVGGFGLLLGPLVFRMTSELFAIVREQS